MMNAGSHPVKAVETVDPELFLDFDAVVTFPHFVATNSFRLLGSNEQKQHRDYRLDHLHVFQSMIN